MTIGLTYDLRSDYLNEGYSEEETAEFDRESTIEAIVQALEQLGYQTDRIGHVRHLIQRLVSGDRWDMVFNICEGMHGIGREAQVPAILDVYQIPYTFSDPMVLSLTLHKGMTKRVVRDSGIPTPAFVIVEKVEDCAEVDIPYPLFVKPNAEGTGKGINALSRVNYPEELKRICIDLLIRYPSGLLVEEFLSGREFTVGILGTGHESYAIGIMEILYKKDETNGIYSYQTKSEYLKSVEYKIPEPEIAEKCIALALKTWKVLGCLDGGRVDIRVDRSGIPNFIEVNPLAGLDKVHSDLPILAYMHGYDFERIIREIMLSARKRAGLM
ncbi:MAG: ATP-grasp domain-containing protein [Bacteroidales bacterium]|nr:ATP-grasp domain-containing protein [Bacteroidales bacterium]